MLLVGKKKELLDFNRTISLKLNVPPNNSISSVISTFSTCLVVFNFHSGFYAEPNYFSRSRGAMLNTLQPTLPIPELRLKIKLEKVFKKKHSCGFISSKLCYTPIFLIHIFSIK